MKYLFIAILFVSCTKVAPIKTNPPESNLYTTSLPGYMLWDFGPSSGNYEGNMYQPFDGYENDSNVYITVKNPGCILLLNNDEYPNITSLMEWKASNNDNSIYIDLRN